MKPQASNVEGRKVKLVVLLCCPLWLLYNAALGICVRTLNRNMETLVTCKQNYKTMLEKVNTGNLNIKIRRIAQCRVSVWLVQQV